MKPKGVVNTLSICGAPEQALLIKDKIDALIEKERFLTSSIVFEDDTRLESDFTMFIPAGDGHSVLKKSVLPMNNAGFIKTDDFSQVIFDDETMPDNIYERERGTNYFKGYNAHLNILCVMDTGDGAVMIYRDEKNAIMIPMPFIGHLLKKAWGVYCRYSKLGRIPRIPGI